MATGADDRERLRSTDRALDLLEVLGMAAARGMSLTTAAQMSGMPKSTAVRYLGTLEARGFVRRDRETGVYRLGFELPIEAASVARLTRAAPEVLGRLREEFRETVTIGVLDGDRVAYVEVAEGPEEIRFSATITDRNHLHSTAGGKAILSTMPERVARRILTYAGMPRLTPHTVTDPDELLAELAVVRERGYAVSDEENALGGRSVGVPVLAGPLRASLTISAPLARLEAERVAAVGAALMAQAAVLRARADPSS
jgi:IclR family acetate operon transcriptional repressor